MRREGRVTKWTAKALHGNTPGSWCRLDACEVLGGGGGLRKGRGSKLKSKNAAGRQVGALMPHCGCM